MNSKYYLTYKNGNRCGDERYSIAIPDNFSVKKGAESRAFIAWLQNGANDDYLNSDIILFDGKIIGENDNDTRLYTPEMCAVLLEKMFWANSFMRRMFRKAKFIPLDSQYPAGGINASYDNKNFQYNIQLFFKGFMKTMRVQILNASEDDIPSCDNMVIEWIKTMKMTEPMDVVKELDDEGFVSAILTEKLISEWKSCADIKYTIIHEMLQNKIDIRLAKFKANVNESSDTVQNAKNDIQKYIDTAAIETQKFLAKGLDGLEAITRKNTGNELLEKLYDVIKPCIVQGDSISIDELGIISGKVSAKIGDFDEIKSRFAALMPIAEDKPEIPTSSQLFEMPTYKEKKKVSIGGMIVTLPDRMLLAEEYHSDNESEEKFLEQLRNAYALVAIPEDFEKGFDFYTEGAFCFNISKPQHVVQFAELFHTSAQNKTSITSDIQSNLINITKNILSRNGMDTKKFPIQYVCGGEDFGIILKQADEQIDVTENWYHFVFFIFHKSDIFQGNVYINAVGKREQFVTAVKELLCKIKVE